MEMNSTAIILALEKQVVCYRRLLKLAAAQHEHVQQSETEQLLDVLTARQEVLDQIQTLEQALQPARRRWPEILNGLSDEDRTTVERMLSETRRLLEEITTADRNDAIVLQQRKLNLGREINQAAAAKQINRSYAAAAYGNRPSRMDLQQ
jgi:hypothetical protein